MLSYVELRDDSTSHRVLTLSPVSVEPKAQGKGLGSSLIRRVLNLADEDGQPLVCLEGSPDFYGRLGFTDSREFGIHFEVPDWAPPNAGQVYELSNYDSAIKGTVAYPPAFIAAEELRARITNRDGARDGAALTSLRVARV
jgi:putative acetyltransferase